MYKTEIKRNLFNDVSNMPEDGNGSNINTFDIQNEPFTITDYDEKEIDHQFMTFKQIHKQSFDGQNSLFTENDIVGKSNLFSNIVEQEYLKIEDNNVSNRQDSFGPSNYLTSFNLSDNSIEPSKSDIEEKSEKQSWGSVSECECQDDLLDQSSLMMLGMIKYMTFRSILQSKADE